MPVMYFSKLLFLCYNIDEVFMYFATIIKDNESVPIAVNEEKTKYILLAPMFGIRTMLQFIEHCSKKEIKAVALALRGNGLPFLEGDTVFDAPIPYPPRNAFCLGKNYRDHLEEIPMLAGAQGGVIVDPIYFTKLAYPARGNLSKVSRYAVYEGELDYETELGVIIGKKGRDIPGERAKEHIFGYTVCNDWSMRNFQQKHSQWFKAKSFDGHLTMGPYIAHESIISYPPKLDLKTLVNGEIRQSSNTEKLIFDLDYIISDLSKGLTLYPGDVILTGTCKGVGMGLTPPKYLNAGDRVTSIIEKIGELTSVITD
jgi:2-keto-4-pentenoate hydratase/2-oxohepta-3-ene-1,7-dioic acid hydratase in catechol pathway